MEDLHARENLNAAEFTASADDVFGRIASRYDLLCDLFSFGIHRHWKRRVAQLVASEPWHDLLDSASGTGDIVLRHRYLLQGIREFPAAEALAEEIRQAGFVGVSYERLSLGIVAIHVAHKPAA